MPTPRVLRHRPTVPTLAGRPKKQPDTSAIHHKKSILSDDIPKDLVTNSATRYAFLHHAILLVREDVVIRTAFLLSSTIFVGLVILLFVSHASLPPVLPFFYSLPWGEQQLIALPFFLISPMLIPLFFLIQIIIAVKMYRNYAILTRLLFFSLCTFSLLLGITLVKIVGLMVA